MKILYFAWVKQEVGFGEEQIDVSDDIKTITDLIAHLSAKSSNYAKAFAEPEKIRCAINQTFADHTSQVSPNDEIAFFPPVTGG